VSRCHVCFSVRQTRDWCGRLTVFSRRGGNLRKDLGAGRGVRGVRTTLPRWCLFVVVEQAEDVVLWEAVAATEEIEFNGEGQTCNFAA